MGKLYVNNELDFTITVAGFDPTSGTLVPISHTYSLPDNVIGKRGHNVGNSDIQIHPNGKFLYVGSRSGDPGLIGVWAIRANEGSLDLVEHVSTHGLIPRNFKIIPCENGVDWLVVGNQETMTIVSFEIDKVSGRLTERCSTSTEPFKACNISFVKKTN